MAGRESLSVEAFTISPDFMRFQIGYEVHPWAKMLSKKKPIFDKSDISNNNRLLLKRINRIEKTSILQ